MGFIFNVGLFFIILPLETDNIIFATPFVVSLEITFIQDKLMSIQQPFCYYYIKDLMLLPVFPETYSKGCSRLFVLQLSVPAEGTI